MVKNDDILTAALKLFADKGFEGTSLQNIADAVGLQKQSLYAHFKNKDDIYFAVIRQQIDYYTSRMDECIGKLLHEPTDVLLAGVFKCMVHAFSCRDRLMIYKRASLDRRSDAEEGASAEIGCRVERKLRETLFGILSERHERLRDPESFKRFYDSYLLTIQGYLERMALGQHDEQVWNDVWCNCWNGLSASL